MHGLIHRGMIHFVGAAHVRLQVSPHGQAVHREVCSRHGIDYEITVYAAPGGLYATWMCPECGFTGVNQILSGTQEQALRLAHEGLGAHHTAAHAPSEPLR